MYLVNRVKDVDVTFKSANGKYTVQLRLSQDGEFSVSGNGTMTDSAQAFFDAICEEFWAEAKRKVIRDI